MSEYVTIVRTRREGTARVLVTALQAHGFHPRTLSDGGLPGLGGGFSQEGYPIDVPAPEAADATPLALDLLKDMADD